ncbi:RNA-binding KH domain-containing protein [Forsythia ovata]|uniref:RNA-binding KH domain-containing protein n=1 Tax=Forsythia ovata TaxID=205694 RepID=A0ABD1WRG5_9LAMI
MAGQRNNNGKRSHSQSDFDDNGGNKIRNPRSGKDSFSIGPNDTVYRYLCPVKKIGSIMGRGGEIIKQLRSDTESKIRIGDSVPGCEERVVTIYSTSKERMLLKVHDRITADDLAADEESEKAPQVTVRLLVPSDQIGCIIGKGGQKVQNIRSETGAQVRIVKDDHLSLCAVSSDELVQVFGEASIVKKALYQIASQLHDNPSRSQNLLTSAPTLGPHGQYKSGNADLSWSFYAVPGNKASSKEFSLRLVCPTAYIGIVIGKGGALINQIRQASGAGIKVDSSAAVGDDCVIFISAKELFEDTFSPTIEAALRLQPRCSEKVERESGLMLSTTRLLVPTSQIGCLIGRGGSIISEMRKITKANIRILSKENLPKVAAQDDELVQIAGDLDVTKNALIQCQQKAQQAKNMKAEILRAVSMDTPTVVDMVVFIVVVTVLLMEHMKIILLVVLVVMAEISEARSQPLASFDGASCLNLKTR